MKLDCRLYRNTLDHARARLIEKSKLQGATTAAAELSCYIHIPLAAVIMYLLRDDVIGETPELRKQLEGVVKFNGYDEIIPFD